MTAFLFAFFIKFSINFLVPCSIVALASVSYRRPCRCNERVRNMYSLFYIYYGTLLSVQLREVQLPAVLLRRVRYAVGRKRNMFPLFYLLFL